MAENPETNSGQGGSVDLPAARIPVFADTSQWDEARERIKREIREIAEEATRALDLSHEFAVLEVQVEQLKRTLEDALSQKDRLDELASGLERFVEIAERLGNIPAPPAAGQQGEPGFGQAQEQQRQDAEESGTLTQIKGLVEQISADLKLLINSSLQGLK